LQDKKPSGYNGRELTLSYASLAALTILGSLIPDNPTCQIEVLKLGLEALKPPSEDICK